MNTDPSRARLTILGAVQGVGFRPFLHHHAAELGLGGWVANSPGGVLVEVEGGRALVEQFILQIDKKKPAHSFVQSMEVRWIEPDGIDGFEIRASTGTGAKTALIMPDIATCPDCLREIFDPGNRRFQYPFTNCTHCGPRYSILEALPYDRPNTSMRGFAMCPLCQAEYKNPADRRFHAQPNACPDCGPQLELWEKIAHPECATHRILASKQEALSLAAGAIRSGKIVAVKGLGGFHLMCDARNEEAVQRLRDRKHREEKPFALLFPGLEAVKAECEVSEIEEHLLLSPAAPIVLLRRQSKINNQNSKIAPAIAPRNPYLGVMLPCTPLHHLLMAHLGFPVVATSGNLSDEPLCTDEHEALERLGGIADLFLVHNRPIVRPVDDSIVRVIAGRELVLRRARGFAPLPVTAFTPSPGGEDCGNRVVLAVGAHLKNSVALGMGGQTFLSQHIGDLENETSFHVFQRVIADLQRLYDVVPEVVATDMHPDYLSSKFARKIFSAKVVNVQHHHAHLLACMAENELQPPVLGVVWDGSGFGPDGTLWGGEFLRPDGNSFTRVAHFRQFRLPGGDRAVREPRRAALGLLHACFCDRTFSMNDLAPVQSFTQEELLGLRVMLERNLNTPVTSSAGRLFDAVASLIGVRQLSGFEGQAAMELEFAAGNNETAYPFPLAAPEAGRPQILDWQPMVEAILADLARGVSAGIISAKFHNALADAIVSVACREKEERIVLTGGCFQNQLLTERAVQRLRSAGLRPFWHQRIPPNDGGIAAGQIAAALLP